MKPTTPTFIVPAETTRPRLDVFLSEQMAISRSQAQKLLKEKSVLVNNVPAKKTGQQLLAGDQISIIEKTSTPENKTTVPKKSAKIIVPKLTIIATTKDYIVIDKPTGLLAHPTMANETYSVASLLTKKYPELKTVGDDPVRPGIVHRLDKEASGLMVIARTQPMFEELKNQFKTRTVGKEYAVLVHDKVAKDWDEIKFRLARGDRNERMAAQPLMVRGEASRLGKEAHTEFLVEKRFVNFSLLKVTIHTGRMHQIRVHMLAYNHPVVGDPLYNQKKRPSAWDKKLGRLFLHCTQLSFTDLKGDRQIFNSPLPKELEDFLKTLS